MRRIAIPGYGVLFGLALWGWFGACVVEAPGEPGPEPKVEARADGFDAASERAATPDGQAPSEPKPPEASAEPKPEPMPEPMPEPKPEKPPEPGAKPEPGPPPVLKGFWLWEKVIQDGKVVQTITNDDMWPKMDSTGWPGCPDGLFCTRYGIKKVAFGDTQIHLHHNVMTSSDYQTLAHYTAKDGVVTLTKFYSFSCAHPQSSYPGPSSDRRYFRYKFQDGKLWISGTSGHLSTQVPGKETRAWVVYKKIVLLEYYGRFMIRFCQEDPGLKCHKDCFSKALVDY